jgi:hypothetical protein
MGSRIASVLPSFKTMAIAGTAAFGAVAFFACCVETTLALPAIYAAGAIWLLSLVTFLRIPATDK